MERKHFLIYSVYPAKQTRGQSSAATLDSSLSMAVKLQIRRFALPTFMVTSKPDAAPTLENQII